jgi:hypothetical protein
VRTTQVRPLHIYRKSRLVPIRKAVRPKQVGVFEVGLPESGIAEIRIAGAREPPILEWLGDYDSNLDWRSQSRLKSQDFGHLSRVVLPSCCMGRPLSWGGRRANPIGFATMSSGLPDPIGTVRTERKRPGVRCCLFRPLMPRPDPDRHLLHPQVRDGLSAVSPHRLSSELRSRQRADCANSPVPSHGPTG